MGLFDGKQAGTAQPQATPPTGQAVTEDLLDQYEGVGLSDITSEALGTAYLSITQPLSDAVVNKVAEEGVFFNNANQKTYGTEMDVVVVDFKIVWDEKDASGKTVGRYEPKGIETAMVPPPPGKTGYPQMVNPHTGNTIIETFAYALVAKDDPEAGVMMMTAGVGSMKAYRNWNGYLRSQTRPNGKPAAIFSKIWRLTAGSKISKTTGKPFYALINVADQGWIETDLLQQAVLPAYTQKKSQLLLAYEDANAVGQPVAE